MNTGTDTTIRDVLKQMKTLHPHVGDDEIIDCLAWEVGLAAEGLVDVPKWIEQALVRTGVVDDVTRAEGLIERLTVENRAMTPDEDPVWQCTHMAGQEVDMEMDRVDDIGALVAAIRDMRRAFAADIARKAARERMEIEMGERCLVIHARLESCPRDELDQAAATMIAMAAEHGGDRLVEEVVSSLIVFATDMDDGDDRPNDRGPRRPGPAKPQGGGPIHMPRSLQPA